MARIADKHGLTNGYREIGVGKRLVKRGRPRTKLLGSTSRKRKTVVAMNDMEIKITAIVLFVIFSVII